MRSSRTFIVAGQLALLTLALASCGRQAVPEAPVGQVAPETTAAQPGTQPAQTAAAQIMTVSVRAGTTEADLLSRYPGSRVLALHASEGYAQLLSSGATAAAPAMGSLSLNAQLLTVTATVRGTSAKDTATFTTTNRPDDARNIDLTPNAATTTPNNARTQQLP